MKKIILTMIAVTAFASALNMNLGGYDKSEPYNPTPTYDYYSY